MTAETLQRPHRTSASAAERVFGRGRLRMVTGAHVEVFREASRPGERRRYTKRFLATPNGDYRRWTEREWRILARLVGHGIGAVPDIVRFDRGGDGEPALIQTYDAGVTVDHWATLLPVTRGATALRHAFEDAAHWFALARHALAALDAVHALALVHLDLKADNVCIPVAPLGAAEVDPRDGAAAVRLDLESLALIDFAFALVSGERLATPLPIARQPDYDYQSPRLLAALEAGLRGDLAPTRELDWRCDFYSLAAMLERYLPAPVMRVPGGWTHASLAEAARLVAELRRLHDGELPGVRPHAALIERLDGALAAPAWAASLAQGFEIGIAPAEDGGDADPPDADDPGPTPVTRIAPALAAVGAAVVAAAARPPEDVVADPAEAIGSAVGEMPAHAFVASARGATDPWIGPVGEPPAVPAPGASRPGEAVTVDPGDAAAMGSPRLRPREPRDGDATARRPIAIAAVAAVAVSALAGLSWFAVRERESAEASAAVASWVATSPAARGGAEAGTGGGNGDGAPAVAATAAVAEPTAEPRPGDSPRGEPADGRGTGGATDPGAAAAAADDRPAADATRDRTAGAAADDLGPVAAVGIARDAAPSSEPTPPVAFPQRDAPDLAGDAAAPSGRAVGADGATPARVAEPSPRRPETRRAQLPAPAKVAMPRAPSASPPTASATVPRTAGAAPRPDARQATTAAAATARSRLLAAAPRPTVAARDVRVAMARPASVPAPTPSATTAMRAAALSRAHTAALAASPLGAPALAAGRAATTAPPSDAAPPPAGPTPSMPSTSSRAPTPAAVVASPGATAGREPGGAAGGAPVVPAAVPIAAAAAPWSEAALRSRADADHARRGAELLATELPQSAQRAERVVLRVLHVAALEDGADDAAVRQAARAARRAAGERGSAPRGAATDARRLGDEARLALRRGAPLAEVVALQTRAFGADPEDAVIAGTLAAWKLLQSPGQAELARQLALHALALPDATHPQGRLEDWTTFAIASSLAGRGRDARAAWAVAIAVAAASGEEGRACRAALDAVARHGDRLRPPVEAMLQRLQGGRAPESPYCEWPPHWQSASR